MERDHDGEDVRMRGAMHRERWEDDAREATAIRTLLHRRNDELLDRLRDPTLPPAARREAERMHKAVRGDIRKAGPGASLDTLRGLRARWE